MTQKQPRPDLQHALNCSPGGHRALLRRSPTAGASGLTVLGCHVGTLAQRGVRASSRGAVHPSHTAGGLTMPARGALPSPSVFKEPRLQEAPQVVQPKTHSSSTTSPSSKPSPRGSASPIRAGTQVQEKSSETLPASPLSFCLPFSGKGIHLSLSPFTPQTSLGKARVCLQLPL